ncbi:MAG TPA: cyclic nucleotide-binding domain-containing protein [Nocardioidaceae bacterium]|nr:cyclic nucleotide-binding domain-containing protein [Nocardioidaceae bacterium]
METIDAARIQSLPLFASLSDQECAELARHVEERDYETGHAVIHQGASGYTFFAIEDGTADVFVDDEKVRSVGPGDFLGEISILDGGRRTATVTATSPMRLLALFGTQFRVLETEHPELAEKIQQVVDQRLA